MKYLFKALTVCKSCHQLLAVPIEGGYFIPRHIELKSNYLSHWCNPKNEHSVALDYLPLVEGLTIRVRYHGCGVTV